MDSIIVLMTISNVGVNESSFSISNNVLKILSSRVIFTLDD